MKKKLSIVTINYNNADGLENTLKSISAQCFFNFELIIIDNNSTDSSHDIIKLYSNLNPKVIIESDNGIYDAMNKGIKNSTGEYVHLLNSGDIYYSDSILSSIFKKPLLDNTLFICLSVSKYTNKKYIWKPEFNLVEDFVDVAHPGIIVKNDFYNTSLYVDTLKYCADSLFIYRNITMSNSLIINDILVEMSPGGVSTSNSIDLLKEKLELIWCYGYRSKVKWILSLKYLLVYLLRLSKLK